MKEAIPVIEFYVDATRNNRAAIDVYSRFVEMYPNDSNARSRLESLRSR